MKAEPATREPGGGVATATLFAASAAVFGLLGGLPALIGPAIGIGGVLIATVWRRRHRVRSTMLPMVPALVAIGALALATPAVPAAELFAGLTVLAFLLWVADDPARPRGGGRRAAPALAVIALGVGLAWAITLAVAGRQPEVGVAGALLAAALVLLAWLVARPQAVLLTWGRNG